MSRVQLEIGLGVILVLLTSTLIIKYGFDEEARMKTFALEQEAQSIEVGAALFENNCSTCHGKQGEGIPGLCPPLNDRNFFTNRLAEVGWTGTIEDYVVATVSSGRLTSTRPDQYVGGGKPAMPAWSEEYGGPLRTDQIRDIAKFVKNWEATALQQVELVVVIPPGETSNDPVVRGQQVYLTVGCTGCHTLGTLSSGVVGPALTHIGTEAGSMKPGMSAEDYIRESIVNPNAFLAPTCPSGPCPANVMPQDWGDKLSEEQLNDLVAFLLAQE